MIRYEYPRLHDWLRRVYWDEGEESNCGAFKKTTHFDCVSLFIWLRLDGFEVDFCIDKKRLRVSDQGTECHHPSWPTSQYSPALRSGRSWRRCRIRSEGSGSVLFFYEWFFREGIRGPYEEKMIDGVGVVTWLWLGRWQLEETEDWLSDLWNMSLKMCSQPCQPSVSPR